MSRPLVGRRRSVAVVQRVQVLKSHAREGVVPEHAQPGVPHVGALEVDGVVGVEGAVESRPIGPRRERVDGDEGRPERGQPPGSCPPDQDGGGRPEPEPRAAREGACERRRREAGSGQSCDAPGAALGHKPHRPGNGCQQQELARERHVVTHRTPRPGREAGSPGDEENDAHEGRNSR